jgi:hypothetical protein
MLDSLGRGDDILKKDFGKTKLLQKKAQNNAFFDYLVFDGCRKINGKEFALMPNIILV